MKYNRVDEMLILNQVAQPDPADHNRRRRTPAASLIQDSANQHSSRKPKHQHSRQTQQKMNLTKMSHKSKCRSNLHITKIKLSMLLLPLVATLISLAEASSFETENSMLMMQQPESSALVNSSPANQPVQGFLLDTTEQKTLGWTKYPDGISTQTRMPGWAEESFTQFERGINWRSFVVCDVAFNSVNNWLWSPYIERQEANRLYIEIKFTMRACNLFPELVLSCKETFALLYKEMDAPLHNQYPQLMNNNNQQQQQISASNLSFAQADSFTLIDAIAADEGRSTSNRDVVINTEVRSIPVSKRGLYFAFRDQGACLSLISVKVYHLSCPAQVSQFALFNATPTGRDLTSLVPVEGQCVANSVQIEQPKMFCGADGLWNSMSSGLCKCLAGFEPAMNNTKCQACPPGKFKPNLGDGSCIPCPERSYAPYGGASECRCQEGFYRAPKDSRSMACSQLPGTPIALQVNYVDSNSVILQWQAPKFTGWRDDLSYRIQCDNCEAAGSVQATAGSGQQLQRIVSSPQNLANFSETSCVLSGLQPGSQYKFLVYAMNGLSASAGTSNPASLLASASEISIQTPKASQQTAQNTLLSQMNNLAPLPIYNFRLLQGVHGSDIILTWDVAQSAAVTSQLDQSTTTTSGAESGWYLFEIRVIPRRNFDPTSATSSSTTRRSPYPASLISPPASLSIPFGPNSNVQGNFDSPQHVITPDRAILLRSLAPATEYAFQIRVKQMSGVGSSELNDLSASLSMWGDWSEPIFGTTPDYPVGMFDYEPIPSSGYPIQTPAIFGGSPPPHQTGIMNAANQFNMSQQQGGNNLSSWFTWFLGSFLMLLLSLGLLALLSLATIRYRQWSLGSRKAQSCLGSLGAGFGGSSSAGGYAGVYGGIGVSGFESSLIGANSTLHHPQQHHNMLNNNGATTLINAGHHNHTLSASSAGGLITGSNATSRSSSSGGAGRGNVVQNFITATLNQLTNSSNTHNNAAFGLHKGTLHNMSSNRQQQQQAAALYQSANTLGGAGKTLFASSASHAHLAGLNGGVLGHEQQFLAPQMQQLNHQRNLYHQASPLTTTTLANNNNNTNNQSKSAFGQAGATHTILLASPEQQGLFQPTSRLTSATLIGNRQQQQTIYHNQLASQQHESIYDDPLVDPRHFKYERTSANLNSNQGLNHQQQSLMMQQQQPNNHIYDDLENPAANSAAQSETCSANDEPTTTTTTNSSSSSATSEQQMLRSQQQHQFQSRSNAGNGQLNLGNQQQADNIDSVLSRAKFYANSDNVMQHQDQQEILSLNCEQQRQFHYNLQASSNQQSSASATNRRQMI